MESPTQPTSNQRISNPTRHQQPIGQQRQQPIQRPALRRTSYSQQLNPNRPHVTSHTPPRVVSPPTANQQLVSGQQPTQHPIGVKRPPPRRKPVPALQPSSLRFAQEARGSPVSNLSQLPARAQLYSRAHSTPPSSQPTRGPPTPQSTAVLPATARTQGQRLHRPQEPALDVRTVTRDTLDSEVDPRVDVPEALESSVPEPTPAADILLTREPSPAAKATAEQQPPQHSALDSEVPSSKSKLVAEWTPVKGRGAMPENTTYQAEAMIAAPIQAMCASQSQRQREFEELMKDFLYSFTAGEELRQRRYKDSAQARTAAFEKNHKARQAEFSEAQHNREESTKATMDSWKAQFTAIREGWQGKAEQEAIYRD
ncbi:hypothetical protein H0H81_001012 [Sphagnurus paluster]|uniref:Uncharacterized protein n=1 Tax=Sphagnurus paluster TaxID=117069 RepID=A0A9P7FP64_9AGAR|nr:hypothetical protein H0H81_001012 [Sphagnurus paluster]